MPFSDPLADGMTNQLAAQRALESRMRWRRCFSSGSGDSKVFRDSDRILHLLQFDLFTRNRDLCQKV